MTSRKRTKKDEREHGIGLSLEEPRYLFTNAAVAQKNMSAALSH